MNTFAHPWPIPLGQIAHAHRKTAAAGNTPYPLGLLQMPMQSISWLLYQAKTAYQIIEWTPLTEGPGTRVDYTGAAEWDGEKFRHNGPEVTFLNPLVFENWGGQYVTDNEARTGLRGYDVLTAENPTDSGWTYDRKPGEWMGAGPWASLDPTTRTDGTMRYDVPANWPTITGEFTSGVAAAITAWQERLQNWLDAEEAKVPPDSPLIADILRQIDVADAVGLQATQAASLMVDAITTLPTDNQGKTNLILQEVDSFARWLAAEEILEAFSVTVMPLTKFRANFGQWIRFLLSRQWFGWDRTFNQAGLQEVQFLGAGLTTAALGPLSTAEAPILASNALPALSTGQIAVNLTRPLGGELNLNPPYGFNANLATIFTSQISALASDGITILTSEQITALGPAGIGLSAQACEVPQGSVVPVYGNGVKQAIPTTQSYPVLAGVEVGVFRIENGIAIGTQAIPGIKIYECPLFANPDRVGALNITWRVLTKRT